jgi:hypothetical protein
MTVEQLKAFYSPIGTLIPIGVGKAPIGKDWTNAEDFHASMFTTGRYGLRPNKGLIIVDIDVKGDGFTTAKHLDLPTTLTQRTPTGGEHRWYKVPVEAVIKNEVRAWAGIDLRVAGKGQCLVYPTQDYDWIDLAIDDGEQPTLDLIADLPPFLLQQLTTENPFKRNNYKESGQIMEGSRNNELASQAGFMRKKGYSVETINSALQAINPILCKQPLDSAEVASIAKSMGRYEPEPQADLSQFLASITPTNVTIATSDNIIFKLTHVSDLIGEPKPIKWLVKGFLMEDTLTMLYASPAAGKSLIAIDMCCCIATGKDWLGNRVNQGSAVILAGEGIYGISRRLKAWEVHNEESLAHANIFVSNTGAALNEHQGFYNAVAAIDLLETKPKLIVIDTLHRNFFGDENSAKDMAQFIGNLDKIRERYHCTVLIVHHVGNGDQNRARGSSSLKAAVDSSFRLELNGEIRSLVCDKSKDARPPASISFELNEVSLAWFDDDGLEETSVVLIPTEKKVSTKQNMLSGANKFAFENLIDVSNGEPVHIDLWRPHFYAKHTSDNQEAKKRAFKRARDYLIDNKIVTVNNDVYTIHPTGSFGDLTGHISGYLVQKQFNLLAKGQGDNRGTTGGQVPDTRTV